jgi:CBS domain-containing protein
MEVKMLVKEAMRLGTEWVSPETKIRDLAIRMRDLDIGSLAVYSDGKLTGIVTDRDIALRCCADSKDPATTSAKEIMTGNIAWCYADQDVEDATQLMEERHIRRLPVLDRTEKLVGFLSVDDLSRNGSFSLAGEVIQAAVAH